MQLSFNKFQLFSLAFVSFALLLFSSCRKEGDNEKLSGQNQSADELIPTDSGSWWLIQANDNTVSKMTATGRDSFIEGNTYNYFEMRDTVTGNITPYFYAKNGGYYLTLISLLDDSSEYMPAIICTVAEKEGDTWENTSQMQYSGMTIDLKTEGNVVSTSETLTLNGHTYHNVIKTKNDLKAKLHNIPLWVDCGSFTMYLAPGIGVLKQDLNISILTYFQKQISNYVLDYHIE